MKIKKEIKTNYIDSHGDYIDVNGIDTSNIENTPVHFEFNNLDKPIGRVNNVEKTKDGFIIEVQLNNPEDAEKYKEFFDIEAGYLLREVKRCKDITEIIKSELIEVSIVPKTNEVK